MAKYIDLLSGNDANPGTEVSPWQYDPDDSRSINGPSVDDESYIYLGDASSSVIWTMPNNAGITWADGVHGVTRKTRPGDFPVIFDWRVFPAAGDWDDPATVGAGANIWRCQLELTASAHAMRLFIEDIAQNQVNSTGELTATRNVYMTDEADAPPQHYIYMYSVGNPETVYGPGNISFVRASGAVNGFYMDADDTGNDLLLENVIARGAATPISINGLRHNITILNCGAEMWGRGGIISKGNSPYVTGGATILPDIGRPNMYVEINGCNVDRVTQIDEFDLQYGEHGGDSIALRGPHIGGRIINCHAQDNGHFAFGVLGWNQFGDGVNGYTHGTIACEIGWNTADNRNSPYGRMIGSVGSHLDGPLYHRNAYGTIHHNRGTNMQTRSQISGEGIWVYNNDFSNVMGTETQYGTHYPGERRSGEGLTLASSSSGGEFGDKNLKDMRVFNNTFVYNRLCGLHVNYGAASGDSGNIIRDNIFLYNNLELSDEITADPGGGDWQHAQLRISGTVPVGDMFEENHMKGVVQEVVVYGNGAATETVSEFNAESYATLNSNTVNFIDGDGRAVTGANNQGAGTLPAKITAVNLISAADTNDMRGYAYDTGKLWWRFPPTGDANVILDEFGVNIKTLNNFQYNAPADAGNPLAAEDITISGLIGSRPEMDQITPGATGDYNLRINDNVTPFITSASKALNDETTEFVSFSGTTALTATRNRPYVTALSNINFPDFHANMAFWRLAYEAEAPLPLQPEYDQTDLDGDDPSGNDYIGAKYTIDTPRMPNVVLDAFGGTFTEATAEALFTRYFYVKGTVSEVEDAAPVGQVLTQSVTAETKNAVGTSVDLTISSGPAVVDLAIISDVIDDLIIFDALKNSIS